MKTEIRKAVGAIIKWKNHPGYVAMVKKVKNEWINKGPIPPEWGIPSGGLEEGEEPEKGLWRELSEEVGNANMRVVQVLPFTMDFRMPPNDLWDRQVTTLFLVEYDGDGSDLKPTTDEIAEAVMMPLDDAKSIVKYPDTAGILEEARKFLLE